MRQTILSAFELYNYLKEFGDPSIVDESARKRVRGHGIERRASGQVLQAWNIEDILFDVVRNVFS
jgi:hypothetical protein